MAINKEELLQALSELQADGYTIGKSTIEAHTIPVANKELVEKLLPELYQALQDGYKIGDSTTEAHTASDNKEKDASEIIEEYYESCARTLTELSKNPAHLVKYVNFINCITDSINKSKETLSTSYRASRGFL